MLGYGTDPSAVDGTNQTAIGYGATGQADNSVTLGNEDVTAVYMAEDAGATVYAAGLNLGGTAVTATAAELNLLDGVSSLNSGATNVNGLSDVLVEQNSIWVGNDPSGTTNDAQYNVAVGTTALDAITTGDKNTAMGFNSMTDNTTGSNNTAYGAYSLYENTTGDKNQSFGYQSLNNNTTGSDNTALGYQSLYSNTTGTRNLAIGYSAYDLSLIHISEPTRPY